MIRTHPLDPARRLEIAAMVALVDVTLAAGRAAEALALLRQIHAAGIGGMEEDGQRHARLTLHAIRGDWGTGAAGILRAWQAAARDRIAAVTPYATHGG